MGRKRNGYNYLGGNVDAIRGLLTWILREATMSDQTAEAARPASPVGRILKRWRDLRGLSQLDLALAANTSSRHLSFVETGRAGASRELVHRLCDALDLPLRERNAALLTAGFAPAYRETALHDAAMAQVNHALEHILTQQEPYPAVVMNTYWDILRANAATGRLMAFLLGPPAQPPSEPPNALRMFFHPDLLRPHIEDWQSAARILVARARREGPAGGPDERMSALIDEVLSYPGVPTDSVGAPLDEDLAPVLSLAFVKDGVRSAWFTTVTTFGTPQDVTLQDLRIESFFPADPETERFARTLAEAA